MNLICEGRGPPATGLPPDSEPDETRGRLVVDVDARDRGVRGTVVSPRHEAIDTRGRALEHRLHGTVRQVPHPTGDAVFGGHPAARVPEEHALYLAGNHDAPTDHGVDVTEPSVLAAQRNHGYAMATEPVPLVPVYGNQQKP